MFTLIPIAVLSLIIFWVAAIVLLGDCPWRALKRRMGGGPWRMPAPPTDDGGPENGRD